MKRTVLLGIAAAIVIMMTAPGAVAQCGCCGQNRAGWRGPGAGFGRGVGFGRGPVARVYNPATVATLRGTISSVEVEPARPGRPGGMHLTLKTDQKSTEVHIGPAWFAQAEGLTFTTGEAIEVTGSQVTRGELSFLVAREVRKADKVIRLRSDDGTPLWAQRGRFN